MTDRATAAGPAGEQRAGRTDRDSRGARVGGRIAVGLIGFWAVAGVIFGLYGVRQATGRVDVASGPVVYANLWQSVDVDVSSGPDSQRALLVCASWLLATGLLIPAGFLGWLSLAHQGRAGKWWGVGYLVVLTASVLIQLRVQGWGDRNVVPQSGEFQAGPWVRGFHTLSLCAVIGGIVSIGLLKPWRSRSG